MSVQLDFEKMGLKDVAIIKDDMIYKIESVEIPVNTEFVLRYSFVLVAGKEYINPDESNREGWVEASVFNEDMQDYGITVYPVNETLEEQIEGDGFKMFDMTGIKIFKLFAPLSEIEEHFQGL